MGFIKKVYYCKECGCEINKTSSLQKYCKKCEILKSKEKVKKQKEKEKKEKKKETAQYKKMVKGLYAENLSLAKLIAKKRDNFTCQKCGNTENIHGSHIINEARDHRLATNENNIKALCYNCHLSRWHKNPVEAGRWFENKFPGRFDELNKLHIKYGKLGKIGNDWHLLENKRLKEILNK